MKDNSNSIYETEDVSQTERKIKENKEDKWLIKSPCCNTFVGISTTSGSRYCVKCQKTLVKNDYDNKLVNIGIFISLWEYNLEAVKFNLPKIEEPEKVKCLYRY